MKHRKMRAHQFGMTAFVVVFLALVTLSIHSFGVAVRRNQTEITDRNLLVASNNGAAQIRAVFENCMATLDSTATILEQVENRSIEQFIPLLNKLAQANGFERMAVDLPSGTSYTSDGLVLDIAQMGYLERVKNGERFITNVIDAAADGRPMIGFFVPLRDSSGRPVASLRLSISTEVLSRDIDLQLFDSEGYYHLVDRNGRYVAAGNSQNALLMEQNFFDAIAQMDYLPGFSQQDIIGTFETGEAAYVKYSVGEAQRYAYCEQVGINSWVLMTIVPRQAVIRQEQQIASLATSMTIQLGLLLLILFIFLYYQQRKAQELARLNDRCFRVLAEQTGKVIFDWDFNSGQITPMANFRQLFGREMVTKDTADAALLVGMVHPEDKVAFESVFSSIRSGQNIDNIRFRVRNVHDEYRWCTLSGIVISDRAGVPYKAIGTLEDIHASIQHEQTLIHRSEIDLLTGLYNKTTTEQLIVQALQQAGDAVCALAIIDIDNFKSVNDRLGHQFGDRVLVDLATAMHPLAQEHDILGRIGGDEFFLLMMDCGSRERIAQRAQGICRAFERTVAGTNGQLCHISASVGISIYPEHSRDFAQLYRDADIALYLTKERGKNHFTIFDGTVGSGYVANRTTIETTALQTEGL